MIDISNALGWLNSIDNCTYLNNETRRLIRVARMPSLDGSRTELILERLRGIAHSSQEPREKAEILLHCASVGHGRTWYPQAARDAREAVILYDADDHRRAVALWMLGTMQWKILQHFDAHTSWVDSKRNFERCQTLFPRPVDKKDWYQEWLWQMKVELAACPEEILTWLNCFERSSLRPSTCEVVKPLQEKVRRQAYPSIYVLMEDLQEAYKRSEVAFERAEIQLNFGLGVYQMGYSNFAIELLRKAVSNFYPGIGSYHKQVIARCMLGAVEWMQELSQNQAAADWMRCVDEFENLRGWADRDNLMVREAWYAEHRDILRSALLERVKPPGPSSPGKTTTEENRPKPPASPSKGKRTYSYQDLLIRVSGDRPTAERLIEQERKKAPMADRNELIHRVVESLIRDNQ